MKPFNLEEYLANPNKKLVTMGRYNEDYLNGLIAKAKKSWEGVDVDSFMKDLRDEDVAEKEQKAIGE